MDWSPWLDDRFLRATATIPLASKDELNADADDFLAQLHDDPRYADFLGEDHARGGVQVMAATQFADDVALAVRHERTATPMYHD